MTYETNIFQMHNLSDISANYRLYDIIGLIKSADEYESNIQYLVKRLSYLLKNPVIVINRGGEPKLVVRDDLAVSGPVPSEFNLTRNTVYIRPTDEILKVDYVNYSAQTREICLRFLNFDLQNHLNQFSELWQPGAGRPFYFKRPTVQGQIAIYDGFLARIVELPTKSFGVLIEATKKFVYTTSLPVSISRDQFNRYKGEHFVYHYGHQWYEVKAEELSDLNASEYKYLRGDRQVSLIEDLRHQISKPHPKELADLPNEASVLLYRDNSGKLKAAPTALCYWIPNSDVRERAGVHDLSIMSPGQRRKETHHLHRKFLEKIKFGTKILPTDPHALKVDRRQFLVPDFEFGAGRILSIRNTPGAKQVNILSLGKTRKSLLLDSSVGFYSTDGFDQQYFVIPKSIEDSVGREFLKDLRAVVDQMYPRGGRYDPLVISYDDRAQTNYVGIGLEIIKTLKQRATKAGYGVVMVPDYEGRRKRSHDELAALVIKELQEQDLYVSVIHTKTVKASYYLSDENGKPIYKVKDGQIGKKLRGYLNNVAINKVLLTNNKWPFVLNTPMFADLTIGIDVKNHTAGFTLVDKLGKKIRTDWQSTKQKEKLSKELTYARLKLLVTKEANVSNDLFSKIVIHRDGRIYDAERAGILLALEDLKKEGLVSPTCEAAILEVAKHSSTALRLFSIQKDPNGFEHVENPSIGSYVIANEREAYLCSTGKEFPHDGTTNPLFVKYNYGEMAFEQILQDMYFLTCLAFTRPEDCSRYPLTIKITDRRLAEVASEYDDEKMELLEQLNIEPYE